MSAALPTPPATPAAATSAPTAAAPVPNAVAAAPTAPRRIAPLRRTNAFVNLRTLRAEPTPALTMPGAWPREKKPDPIQAAVEATQKEIKLKRKRAEEDAARDEKRRRVESDAPAPSRAEARSSAGEPANNAHTGATASTHQIYTATAATSAARNPTKIKATLSKCPPPPPLTSKAKAAPSTSTGASTSSSSASTSAQLRKTALLREAPTLLDIGTIVAPSSVTTLSRQPAVMFGIDATAQASTDPALVPGAGLPLGQTLAAGFLPAVSGSPPRRKRETPHSPPPPPRKKRRGKRSGHRSRKLDERHDTTEKEDKDRDGASASA